MTNSKKPGPYNLEFVDSALADWAALDNSVKQPLKKQLEKRLINPHVPGCELRGSLQGCYKIKLSKLGVRLVYEVDDDRVVVMVIVIDKREDGKAYTVAEGRIKTPGLTLVSIKDFKIPKKK